ncbi:MAG: hypothetical protein NTW86_06580 [Candidatus Sumerlaeota bacterium]|nr:hypothetical protein [Candidatus Sumerlaeota bacterium]
MPIILPPQHALTAQRNSRNIQIAVAIQIRGANRSGATAIRIDHPLRPGGGARQDERKGEGAQHYEESDAALQTSGIHSDVLQKMEMDQQESHGHPFRGMREANCQKQPTAPA